MKKVTATYGLNYLFKLFQIIYLFTKKGLENIRINCYCEISSEIGPPRGLSEIGYER